MLSSVGLPTGLPVERKPAHNVDKVPRLGWAGTLYS